MRGNPGDVIVPSGAMADVSAMAEVSLGIDAEAFVLSPLGKYLIERSERELEQAVEALKRVAPDDSKVIAALLHKIRVAESVPQWLADAIQAGHNAEHQLRTEADG